jgi:hypothetical protein
MPRLAVVGVKEGDGVSVEWGTQVWLDEVRQLISDALSLGDLTTMNEMPRHSIQPWSTVWTVDWCGVRYWFKANSQGREREGTVQAIVADLAPEYVDAPIAVDPWRGWILTRDGGPIMLDRPGQVRGVEIDSLVPMLADYARLQRRTLRHRGVLASAGVELTPAHDAAAAARAHADYLRGLPADDPRRINDEQYVRVLSALPALQDAARTLMAGPVPSTLDQCDLWPGNILCPPAGGGHYRFFDFADAGWGHPFGSLVMLATECVFRWQVPQPEDAIDLRDPRIREVFDAYLRQWTDFAPVEQLRELAKYALQTSALNRSAAWLRNLNNATADDLAQYGTMPWAWLEDATKPVLL